MPATLRLVQLNMERSKHLDLIIPFLKSQNGDVVCFQELMERDVLHLERELSMKAAFEPMFIHPADGNEGVLGVGIFSRHRVVSRTVEFAHGVKEPLQHHVPGVPDTLPNPVLICDIEKDGVQYRIATVHFTWAANGGSNEIQFTNIEKLFNALNSHKDFVLTGDFNAPRGKEIFTKLAAQYTDNVPPHYTSSIDGTRHKAGALPYMVDGIFSTSGYSVSNVEMHSGVSDHCALTADVARTRK